MSTTRGNLVPARIVDVDKEHPYGNKGTIIVECHFNPFEYTVSKTNSYDEKPQRGKKTQGEFKKEGPQTLKLTLHFDTYESGEDVSYTTNKLWKFMEPIKEGSETDKKPPPTVAFEWGGVFRFVAVITNMSQKFTLFKNDGTPVRAQVDVTFTQYQDVNDYPKQNPTSGGGPISRTWVVVLGDRLDLIAAEVYGDATKWRAIADYNDISDPLRLRPGRQLAIPQKP